jgi:hypothetical protein
MDSKWFAEDRAKARADKSTPLAELKAESDWIRYSMISSRSRIETTKISRNPTGSVYT